MEAEFVSYTDCHTVGYCDETSFAELKRQECSYRDESGTLQRVQIRTRTRTDTH